jgi:hypothetical protein
MSFLTLLHQLLDHFRAARDRLLSWIVNSVTIIAAAIAVLVTAVTAVATRNVGMD